jgi:hypothetical protein
VLRFVHRWQGVAWTTTRAPRTAHCLSALRRAVLGEASVVADADRVEWDATVFALTLADIPNSRTDEDESHRRSVASASVVNPDFRGFRGLVATAADLAPETYSNGSDALWTGARHTAWPRSHRRRRRRRLGRCSSARRSSVTGQTGSLRPVGTRDREGRRRIG